MTPHSSPPKSSLSSAVQTEQAKEPVVASTESFTESQASESKTEALKPASETTTHIAVTSSTSAQIPIPAVARVEVTQEHETPVKLQTVPPPILLSNQEKPAVPVAKEQNVSKTKQNSKPVRNPTKEQQGLVKKNPDKITKKDIKEATNTRPISPTKAIRPKDKAPQPATEIAATADKGTLIHPTNVSKKRPTSPQTKQPKPVNPLSPNSRTCTYPPVNPPSAEQLPPRPVSAISPTSKSSRPVRSKSEVLSKTSPTFSSSRSEAALRPSSPSKANTKETFERLYAVCFYFYNFSYNLGCSTYSGFERGETKKYFCF